MPLNVIQAPINISNTGDVIPSPQITALSNGGYAVAYTFGNAVINAVFDAQGHPIASGGVIESIVEGSPDIAGLSGGGYALAWEDDLAGEIFTAVYNAQGQQLSAAVNASNSPAANLFDTLPVVEALSTGGYALTWDVPTTPGNYDIFTAVHNAQGQQVVAPINVSDTPNVDDQGAVVAALSNGNYALTWRSGTFGGDYDIFTAVYAANGQQIAAPLDVTNTNAVNESDMHVAALSTGGYAVTWEGQAADGSSDIFTAVYDAQGHVVAAPVDVAAGNQTHVAALSNGNYALFWSGGDVFTAVYSAQGVQLSAPVDVSNTIGLADFASQVTALSNGAYAVTWEGQTADGSSDIFTAVYNAQGQQVVAPVDVSNSPGADDTLPEVTALANGAYALTWLGPSGFVNDAYTAVYQFVDSNSPGDVSVIGSPDIAIDLSALVNVGGSLTVTNNGAAVSIDLSNLVSIGGNFKLSDNGALLTIVVPALSSVGGNVDVAGNLSVGSVSFTSLSSVGGNVDVSDLSVGSVSLPSLSNVGGNVDVSNSSVGSVSFTSLSNVGGNVDVTGNSSVGSVSFTSLSNVGGNVDVTGNSSVGSVSFTSLSDVGGNVNVSDLSVGSVSFTSLSNVGGNVDVSNSSVGSVSFTSLSNVGGNVDVTGNSSVGSVSFTSLSNVSGNVDVSNSSVGSVSFTSLSNVGGNVDVTGNSSVGSISLPALASANDVSVSGNAAVITIDLGALIQAGAIIIADNGVITLNLSKLVKAGGDVAITNNDSLLTIDMPNLTDVTGDVNVSNNDSATSVTMHALSAAGGNVDINGNTAAGTVDLSNLTSAGGNVDINGNTAAGTVDLGNLTSAGGNVDINGNTAAGTVDLGNLTSAGGNVDINGNTAAGTVDLGNLTSAGGNVDVNGNTAAGTVDLGNLTSAGGNVDVNGNTAAGTIDLGSLDSVNGDVTVNAAPDAKVDASGLGPGGGSVVLIGDITTTVTVGSLAKMTGTLTITSADGVAVSAKAGLANISMTGTASDDTLIGSTKAANTMDGGSGNDSLTGGNADDVITGGAGNDTLDGKGGTNTAVYSGKFSDYAIVQNADGSLTVADTRANSPDGTDTLRNFGLFKFADSTHTLADALPSLVITSNGGGDSAVMSIPENTAAVTQVTATDPNAAQTLAFAIAGGTDAAKFQIDPASGVLSFITAPNFEARADAGANDVYDVIVQASDGFHFDTQALAVAVTDVNESPVVAALNGSIGEDGPSFSRDLLAGASDPDAGDHLSVLGLDTSVTTTGGRALALGTDYTLNGPTLALTAPGFAKFNSLAGSQTDQAIFHFGVSDGLLTTPNTLALIVTGANDAPLVVPQTASAGEDGPSSSRDLLAGASDPDAGDHLSVLGLDTSVTTTGGRALALGTDYTLNGSILALTAAGFAKFNSLSDSQTDQAIFHFGASDGTVATADTLTLNIVGADDAPFLASQTANQSATAETPFALILPASTFQDPDSGDHLSLAATASNGPALPAWLSFNPTTGAFSGTAGLGDVGAFDVTVTATDTGGLTATDTFHFSIAAPSTDHPPVITSDGGGDAASIIVTGATKYVATVHAVDPDQGATLAYSIIGGADQKLFAIDSNTGVLSFKSTPQDGHSYQVTVAASDGSLKDTQAIAVHVANGPLEFSNPGVADTFVFKPHFGLAVVNNFDAGSTAHDVLELNHALFRNADVNASPSAILNLVEDHSYQLGRDVVIVTDTHDVIDLRNTSLHSLTAHDFILT
jgi:Putative Ig domain/Bacterial cadherin-like domain/RTX calcium-binding nonapeptide repeat (4 copies)